MQCKDNMGALTEDKESSPSHAGSTCAAKKKTPLPSVGKVTGMKRGGSAKGEGDKGSKVLSLRVSRPLFLLILKNE